MNCSEIVQFILLLTVREGAPDDVNCQSHYIISKGQIIWAAKWSANQIESGRAAEELSRKIYYDNLYKNKGILRRAWNWIKKLFG